MSSAHDDWIGYEGQGTFLIHSSWRGVIFLKTWALTCSIRNLIFTMLQVPRYKGVRGYMQMQGWWSTLL